MLSRQPSENQIQLPWPGEVILRQVCALVKNKETPSLVVSSRSWLGSIGEVAVQPPKLCDHK
eukprot:3753077-Amphidinium_carterae.1